MCLDGLLASLTLQESRLGTSLDVEQIAQTGRLPNWQLREADKSAWSIAG